MTTEMTGFFKEGFKQYYNNPKYSDIKLIHKQTDYSFNGHKLILTYKSGYFQKMLSNDENMTSLTIDFEDLDQVLPKLLEFLYEGKVDINFDNVVSMKIAANFFEIPELVAAVEKFLDANFNSKNVITILEKALKCKDEIIIAKSIEYVAKSINTLLTPFKEKISNLDKDTALDIFFKLIGSEALSKSLRVSDSSEVRKLISQWIDEMSTAHNVVQNKKLLSQLISALTASDLLPGSNAMKFLSECEKLGLKKQADACARVLAKTFHEIKDAATINEMSPSTFLALMSCDELHVKAEDQVYSLVQEYTTVNAAKLKPEDVKNLYMAVRYTFLSIDLLKQLKLKPPPEIPLDHIIDAFWYRINRLEGSSGVKIAEKDLPKHFKQRKNRIFVYQTDFDKNGILYFLGTNFGKEPYQNPHIRGLVVVTATAAPETGKVEETISHDPAKCNLVAKPNTHVLIDFKEHKIMATKYTLRHTLTRDTEALRNWSLEASNDGTNFKEIIKHVNDSALNTKGGSHTWDLDPSKSDEFFRYWRIVQWGNNSSNNQYFSLAGAEFYGLLKKVSDN